MRVIVVGAGVVGCSIAMHLARAGAKVRVFDKGDVCAGMSARSGALVRMHYTFAPEADLAWKSLRYFQNWAAMVGGDCGFTRTGFAVVVNEENAAALRANVAHAEAASASTPMSSLPTNSRASIPHVSTAGVALAAYEPQSGYADPVATTLSMADAARRAGAEFHLNTPVASVRARAARVFGVLATSRHVPRGRRGMPRHRAVDRRPARALWREDRHHRRARANRVLQTGARASPSGLYRYDRGQLLPSARRRFDPRGLGAWKTRAPPPIPTNFANERPRVYRGGAREAARRIPALAACAVRARPRGHLRRDAGSAAGAR